MKQTIIILIVLVSLVTGRGSVWADSNNPFGFETMKHPIKYGYCKRDLRHSKRLAGYYRCSSAPRPHPDLGSYDLWFVDGIGLCSITAHTVGDLLAPDIVEQFKDQITKKYGTARTRETSIIAFPKGFDPQYVWFLEDGDEGIGDVSMIDITADHNSPPSWIRIHFSLTKHASCLKKLDEKRNQAF